VRNISKYRKVGKRKRPSPVLCIDSSDLWAPDIDATNPLPGAQQESSLSSNLKSLLIIKTLVGAVAWAALGPRG